MAESRTQSGYMVIADISGYTAFFAGTELEHAQAIMEELMAVMLKHVAEPFKLVKLEGDAVFFYALEGAFLDGNRLVEALERFYFDFTDHRLNMSRSTTCQCGACRAIPSLDLKFMAHYGQFIIQRLAGLTDLAGADVIVLHRLLKNHVIEQTGIKAYLYATEACLSQANPRLNWPRHAETYEHLGAVQGAVHDLTAAWKAMTETRREFVELDQADMVFEAVFSAPPPIVWDYATDPQKALQWANVTTRENRPAANGRMGVGTTTHCAHGKASWTHTYLDWRPFNYFTELAATNGMSLDAPPDSLKTTWVFTPDGENRTRVRMQMRLMKRPLPMLLMMKLIGKSLRQKFEGDYFVRLERLLKEGQAALALANAGQSAENS